MPKAISEDIHQLIHSLSKSEKRFFKLFASRLQGEKKFIELFDIVEKQKHYNEEKILKTSKAFSRKQFPNMKLHLYNQILRSLSIGNIKTSVDLQLHHLLGQSQLLYNKCLYRQAMKILEKAKKISIHNHRDILLLEILQLEKKIMLHTVSVRTEERIQEITRASERSSRSIKSTDTFSNLSLKLNAFYMRTGFIRNKSDHQQVQLFFKKTMPAHIESKLSFQEKLYLYHCYTGLCFFTQDFEKGYHYCKKMMSLFESEPQMRINSIEMYIKALDYKLIAENKLFLYDEFQKTHRQLISLKRSDRKILNENVNLNLFRTIYIHEINRHFMLGEFTQGTRIVGKLEKELERFITKLDEHTILILYYKVACLYFGASNFKQALKWLNKIINSRGGLRDDIHAFARILALISHYELGRRDLLEYAIRSTYRFLLQKGDLNNYQSLILGFLRQLNDYTTEKELNRKFVRLRAELMPLEKHPFEKRPFLYFDIISWLDSKIQGKLVEEVIRAKARKRAVLAA